MDKKLKLSPWHDGSVKPVHIGVYQRQFYDGIAYALFDGNYFYRCAFTVSDASKEKIKSAYSGNKLKWRGVLK